MEGLFNIANEEYYIDIDRISDCIRIDNNLDYLLSNQDEVEEDEEELPNNLIQEQQMIDVAKWEVIKALMETILNENGVLDESMGIKKLESQLSIPFRLSFNTLLKNKIIRKNG
jgi:hypothetical protein